MENGEEPQRQAAARQACPPPSEVLPPCSAPIWASCLDWESLGSPSNRWKPAPKGVWSWQGQGGAKACLPGTGVSQPLLPQTQESRPPDPPPSDPGVQGPQTLLPQTQESRNPPLGLIGTQASAPQPSLRFQGWIAGFLPNFSSPAFQASISFLSCLPLISLTCAHDLISPLSPSLGLPLRGG